MGERGEGGGVQVVVFEGGKEGGEGGMVNGGDERVSVGVGG